MRSKRGAFGTVFDRVDALFDKRFTSRPSSVVLLEIFLGIGWLRSSVAKMLEPEWWSGDELAEFVTRHSNQAIGWYQPVLDTVILDRPAVWAGLVLLLELLVAVSLLRSTHLTLGLITGLLLNINFVLAGAPSPSIFYLVLQFGLMLWLLEASTRVTASMRTLRFFTVSGLLLAATLVLDIRTIDPALVIEDPAATLATWALCVAAASAAARRRVKRLTLHTAVIDARELTGTQTPVG